MRTITWDDLRPLLETLSATLISDYARACQYDDPERIGHGEIALYGVPRGGAVVVSLLIALDPRFSQCDRDIEADFVVDDLIDSGKTMERHQWVNCPPFHALIDKRLDRWHGQWIEFPWEVGSTQEDMESNVIRLLEFWGEDPKREGLIETPKRFLKGMGEMLAGYKEDPKTHLAKLFDISDIEASAYDQVIISKDLPFVSFCEHHLMPFYGSAHIAYLPGEGGKVVGLSKLARCLEGYSKRLQVQERLTRQILDAIEEVLAPKGSLVIINGTHTCQCWRGVQKGGNMVTSALGGVFLTDPAARGEVLSLLKL